MSSRCRSPGLEATCRPVWVCLSLLGAACVDLSRPRELSAVPGSSLADAATSASDAGPADGALAADLAVAPDRSLPDAGPGGDRVPAADVAALPPADTAAPGPEAAAPGPDAAGPDASRPLDAARPADGGTPLLVDDFSDGQAALNSLGGVVTTDNLTLVETGGTARFAWTGQGTGTDLLESFRGDWCPVDVTGYRTVRLRARASMPGRSVVVTLSGTDARCATTTTVVLGTLPLTTTMAIYELDLSAVTRVEAGFLELDPATLDVTEYTIDDLELVP
jgi:hypothetical protein